MGLSKLVMTCVTLLLLTAVIVSGCWFYAEQSNSSTQIVQVTPMPVRATMPFIAPAVVRATPVPVVADASQVANNNQADGGSNVPVAPHSIPTPLPASENAVRGEMLEQMLQIDRTWEVTTSNQLEFEEDVVLLYLDEFFNNDFDPFTGTPPTLTDKMLSLDGRQVELRGYMAPPLKLGLDWFLFGELPMGVCPFHANVGSITSGSALVYVEGPEYPFSSDPLSIIGEFHIGELTDPETGMVSLARLYTQKENINVLTLPRP